MSTTTQPSIDERTSDSISRRLDIEEAMPESLKTVCRENPHLFDYISGLPLSEIGMPEYVPELSRKMGDNKKPNYIYPAHWKGVFVHILFDSEGVRNQYIPIEPSTTGLKELMQQIEIKLMALRHKLPLIDPGGDKQAQLIDMLDMVASVDAQSKSGILESSIGFLRKGGIVVPKIKVTQREMDALRYLFVRDKLGLRVMDPLMKDPYIEDISCSGTGNLFVEHKIFKSLKSSIVFATHEELDEYVLWLSDRVKRPVTNKRPIQDTTLPDGSRINIVYGRNVSKRGSNYTIRKFSETPLSVFELLEFGTVNYQMLAYLSLTIGCGMNVFVSGETASGKTTLLNALTTFIPPLAKVVSLEDTPELQVPHKHWLREVAKTSGADDSGGAVNMFDLLRAALRQRPDVIIVGEIRGKEGNVAFQAMQTGHSVMATFHAASVEKLIQRLTGDPILVPKNYVESLNVVILTSQVQLPTGRKGRRLTGIAEIVSYDPVFQSFSFVDSFKWNQVTDIFEFQGYMTSHILENKVAPRLGYSAHKKTDIYAELTRRATILEKLHKEKKVTGFYELLEVLSKAKREGLF
jgi:flagellar protein FlaI